MIAKAYTCVKMAPLKTLTLPSPCLYNPLDRRQELTMKLFTKITSSAALPALLTIFATVALAGPVGPWYASNNIDTSGSVFLTQLQSIDWGINVNTSPG